jgi:methylated-DNA-[protein]-cysteine S-methyltransferase
MKFSHDCVQTEMPSPLGKVLLAASARGLVGLWFEGQKHAPDASLLSHWQLLEQAAAQSQQALLLNWAIEQVQAYFEARLSRFDLPLDCSAGSDFQQAVWRVLVAIHFGQTRSYGDIANELQKPLSARAVGAAVGRNPISIIVPCHRVVGRQGGLTGYAGGLDRKQYLLHLEHLHA